MKHQFHIEPVHRDPIDLERFVSALVALAIKRLEEERQTPDGTEDAEAGRD